MKWTEIPNGVEYDWNELDGRWGDLKEEINNLPKNAVKRHSLGPQHLASQVCWADSDARHGEVRGNAARGPNIRGLWRLSDKMWYGTGPVSGTDVGTVGMVAECYAPGNGIDLFKALYKDNWNDTDRNNPDDSNFRTQPTGVLVMAEIEIQSATFKARGAHIAGAIVAYLGSETGYTQDFIPPASIRYIRQNHEGENQRIEMSWRYMLNWNDFNQAVKPSGTFELDDIKMLKGVGLALWGCDNGMEIYYKNARLSVLCLEHGHCIRSTEGT